MKPLASAESFSYQETNQAIFTFNGSSLGDPSNVTFAPEGGEHNLIATYKNNTTESVSTTFIVAVKKEQRVVSLYVKEKEFGPTELYDFTQTIDIPATSDNENVEVDFYLWDGLSTMKTKCDTVKNILHYSKVNL